MRALAIVHSQIQHEHNETEYGGTVRGDGYKGIFPRFQIAWVGAIFYFLFFVNIIFDRFLPIMDPNSQKVAYKNSV